MKHLLIFLICCASVFGAARTFDATGNWSDATKWDGGVAVPGPTDTITISDGATCDIDAAALTAGALTVVSITNVTTGTITVDSTVVTSINANLTAEAVDLMVIHSGGAVTITGDLVGGSGAGDDAVVIAEIGGGVTTASLTVNGDVSGGPAVNAATGIYSSTTGTLVITGNLLADASYAVIITQATQTTVNGNITGSTLAGILNNKTNAVLVVNGDVTGGAGPLGTGISQGSSLASTTINGTAIISTTTAYPISGLGLWNISQVSYPSTMAFPGFGYRSRYR